MNRRLIGNILIFTLLVLIGSGIYMYFRSFNKGVAAIHTLFSFAFILAIVAHLTNNKRPLTNYITGKRKSLLKKLQAPFVIIVGLGLALALYFEWPVFNQVYEFGNSIRNKQLGKKNEYFDYEIISLDKIKGNHYVEIELRKGKSFQYPLFAIWAEDSLGNYIETLYISRVIASSSYTYGEEIDGKWKPAIKRRPEALPYWSHKRGIKASDGLFVPLHNTADIDGVSGATPTGNFLITSKPKKTLRNYRILLEVNQSYDWNYYYTPDKFPNDRIYTGSGKVGQPSLIYASKMFSTFPVKKTYHLMRLIGHGHHSGKNGELYQELSNLTTAKEIVDRIIISFYTSNKN